MGSPKGNTYALKHALNARPFPPAARLGLRNRNALQQPGQPLGLATLPRLAPCLAVWFSYLRPDYRLRSSGIVFIDPTFTPPVETGWAPPPPPTGFPSYDLLLTVPICRSSKVLACALITGSTAPEPASCCNSGRLNGAAKLRCGER
jgi:hypothetical protein